MLDAGPQTHSFRRKPKEKRYGRPNSMPSLQKRGRNLRSHHPWLSILQRGVDRKYESKAWHQYYRHYPWSSLKLDESFSVSAGQETSAPNGLEMAPKSHLLENLD